MRRHNRYSSWLNVIDQITTDQINLNLYTYISTRANTLYGWTPASGKKLRAFVTIAPGVNIYSNNPGLPALSVPAASFRSYDLVFLNNRGHILGAGGAVGVGAKNGAVGGNGGVALQVRRGNVFVTNEGNIWGGGGGGGGGGGFRDNFIASGQSIPTAAQIVCSGRFCIDNGPAGANQGICGGGPYCGGRGATAAVCPPLNCGAATQYNTNEFICNIADNPAWPQVYAADCWWCTRTCPDVAGGNGGAGQRFNFLAGIGVGGVSVARAASGGFAAFTGDSGAGGGGGNWGQPGSRGVDGLNGFDGLPGVGGNGGAAGSAIDALGVDIRFRASTGSVLGPGIGSIIAF